MKNKSLISIFLLAILLISGCRAQSGELTIQNAWARPASNGNNGAAYFTLENGTSSEDRLLSVTTEIADAAEVHMSMMHSNGVMSMQMQEEVAIPSGESLEFKPGGLHVMFIGLNQDLKAGDIIFLTLNFEKAGNLAIEIPVKEQ